MLNFLKLNLQFFAADDGGGSGDGFDAYYDNGTNQNADTTKQDDSKATEDMIPKKRFDDINNRYKTLNDDYKNRQVEYDEMTKKVTDGEASSKQLQETIDAGTARVEALEGVLQTMLTAELEAIDEEYRELVPSDRPIEEQLKWLAAAKGKGLFGSRGIDFEIGSMTNPNTNQSSKGARITNASPIELLTMGYSK